MSILDSIKELCEQKGITMTSLERDLDFGKGTIRNWDKSSPSIDKLQKVADYFHVSIDKLTQREDKILKLNARDEKDIAKSLEKIMQNLENGEALAYGGEIPSEDRELYRVAIQGALEMVKIKNKERFTPKKYR